MRAPAIIAFFAAALAAAGAADAQTLHAALTEQEISIDRGFAGARIILFGAVRDTEHSTLEGHDLVVIVRGPPKDFSIRQKSRIGGFWIAGEPVIARAAPSLYFVGSTRPLAEIVDDVQRERRQLGAEFLRLSFAGLPPPPTPAAETARPAEELTPGQARDLANPPPEKIDNPAYFYNLYRDAFVRAMKDDALYTEQEGAVRFLEGGLFQVTIDLPATTPVGVYRVIMYLIENGEVAAYRDDPLFVNKVGLERQIYDLAHNRPLIYGLICVLVSLLAGWAAALVLRK
ncbi:MAG: TIGR02186 family protein [Parvularculaceae bacterium]